MQDFEKLGLFYLGKEYDLTAHRRKEEVVLYDSKDLVTHAVCVGMTGSGKTGLCIGLLEEAALDGIPSIAIDPKGDLSNLLLNFPGLTAQEFLPWIQEQDAATKGASKEDYAQKQAELWQKGLAEWGQDAARIQRLSEAADFAIYTPGSNAGLPLSILKSFEAPDEATRAQAEYLRDRITNTVTSLLALLGIEAHPLQSREHILLSTIFDAAWAQGRDLDLALLIQQIQDPPFTKIGVFDLESFYPAKDRFALSMQINNLLAAPGFDIWRQGEPLDAARLLFTNEGKPRVSIYSIAHLNDQERMFAVSYLLTEIVAWVRRQPGTTSLRAIVYMDEIFGYFPPVANPPSKEPLLTLLKQARAFGVGIVLATQNPVDLDYKGLANAGTWFIGRLQTERDKERLLDGLEGAGGGARFDRAALDKTLSALGSRIFLMNNVHEDEPTVFETRWVLSYLRGPLTRNEIAALMEARKTQSQPEQQPKETSAAQTKIAPGGTESRPTLPPDVPQYFAPIRTSQPADAVLQYRPMIVGVAGIYYADAKVGLAVEQSVVAGAPAFKTAISPEWEPVSALQDTDLEKFPVEGATYEEPAGEAKNAKSYPAWTRAFTEWVYRNQPLQLWKNERLQIISKPGESERDFRIRIQQKSREQRDQAVERLRQRYLPKITALQDRIRRSEQSVQREQEQAKQQKMQTAISFGATILGAILGRKKTSVSTIGRATTAARGVGRTMKESEDIERAQANVGAQQKQLTDLQAELESETTELTQQWNAQSDALSAFELRPKKSNIAVKTVALVWMPYWRMDDGTLEPAWSRDAR